MVEYTDFHQMKIDTWNVKKYMNKNKINLKHKIIILPKIIYIINLD